LHRNSRGAFVARSERRCAALDRAQSAHRLASRRAEAVPILDPGQFAAGAMLKSSWHSARAGAARMFGGVEGWILLAGALLVLLTMLGFGVGWLFAPEVTLGLAAMTGLNLLIGLAAGMSFGYAHGFGSVEVIASSVLSDTLQVLIFYPLFVLSWQRLIDLGRLGPYLARLHASAASQQGWVRRFGIAGLVLFVFAPLWMTGPVVGSVIGFLIGLRARVNLPVVLLSSYLAIGLWALLFGQLNALAAVYHRWALFGVVVAVLLLAFVVHRIMRRR
jgi:uncharacterized membrane protein